MMEASGTMEVESFDIQKLVIYRPEVEKDAAIVGCTMQNNWYGLHGLQSDDAIKELQIAGIREFEVAKALLQGHKEKLSQKIPSEAGGVHLFDLCLTFGMDNTAFALAESGIPGCVLEAHHIDLGSYLPQPRQPQQRPIFKAPPPPAPISLSRMQVLGEDHMQILRMGLSSWPRNMDGGFQPQLCFCSQCSNEGNEKAVGPEGFGNDPVRHRLALSGVAEVCSSTFGHRHPERKQRGSCSVGEEEPCSALAPVEHWRHVWDTFPFLGSSADTLQPTISCPSCSASRRCHVQEHFPVILPRQLLGISSSSLAGICVCFGVANRSICRLVAKQQESLESRIVQWLGPLPLHKALGCLSGQAPWGHSARHWCERLADYEVSHQR